MGGVTPYWSLIDSNDNVVFNTRFDNYIGVIEVATSGEYTILMEGTIGDNSNSNNYSFNILPIASEPTPLTFGETISSTMEQDRYNFSLDEDSLLYFDSFTNDSKFSWSIVDSEGTEYFNRKFTDSDGRYVDNPVLDLPGGDYQLQIENNNGGDNYSFRLLDLAEGEELPIGTPVEKDFLPPNKTDIYRFAGNEGERYFFDYQSLNGVSNFGRDWTRWKLVDPQGNIIFHKDITTDVQDVTLPETGNYTLLIEGHVAQYSNNNNAEYKFQVNPIAVDLTAANLTAPVQITWGEEFTLAWQVTNQGSLTSTGWSDRIYLSKDATLDEADLLIGSISEFVDISVIKDESHPRREPIIIDTLDLDRSTEWYLLVEVDTIQSIYRDRLNGIYW